MKILFQCNTVYQLFVVMAIKDNFYKNDECNIIISDIMNDSDKIAERLSRLNIFEKVYIQKIKDIAFTHFDKLFIQRKKELLFKGLEDILNISFDKILFSNPSPSNILMYKILSKVNKNIELDFFEDGLSTYSNHVKELYVDNTQNYRRFFFNNKLLVNGKKIYVFNNQYFMWKPKQDIIMIPPIKPQDKLVQSLNFIFDYSDDVLPNDCKVLFFEEGFYGDNKPVNDYEIIINCINKFGIDGFYVKTHPRNKINRFEKKGIKTLPTSSIPWELIVINNINRINNMKLITISSAAMYTTNYMFSCTPSCYSCINLINNKDYLFKHIPDVEEIISKKLSNFIIFEDKDFN